MTKSDKTKAKTSAGTSRKTKAEQIVGMLCRPHGASITEMMKATGWQAHSVRGFLSGYLKKQGRAVQSDQDQSGTRRYRLEATVS